MRLIFGSAAARHVDAGIQVSAMDFAWRNASKSLILAVIMLGSFQFCTPASAGFFDFGDSVGENVKYRIVNIEREIDEGIDEYENDIINGHFQIIKEVLNENNISKRYKAINFTFFKVPFLVSPNATFPRLSELRSELQIAENRVITPWGTFEEARSGLDGSLRVNLIVSEIQTVSDLRAILVDAPRPGAGIFMDNNFVEFSKCFLPLLKSSEIIVLFSEKVGRSDFKKSDLDCVSPELAPPVSFFLLYTRIPRTYLASYYKRMRICNIYLLDFYKRIYEDLILGRGLSLADEVNRLEFIREFGENIPDQKPIKLGEYRCEPDG